VELVVVGGLQGALEAGAGAEGLPGGGQETKGLPASGDRPGSIGGPVSWRAAEGPRRRPKEQRKAHGGSTARRSGERR
jgi:hypothetical protein